MADGQDLAMLALLKASEGRGGSGCAPILLGAKLEQNIGANLANPGLLKADGMVNKLPQGKPGAFAKLCESMGFKSAEIAEGLKKVAQAGAVSQCSITDITGQSHGLGGGFSAIGMNVNEGGGREV